MSLSTADSISFLTIFNPVHAKSIEMQFSLAMDGVHLKIIQ